MFERSATNTKLSAVDLDEAMTEVAIRSRQASVFVHDCVKRINGRTRGHKDLVSVCSPVPGLRFVQAHGRGHTSTVVLMCVPEDLFHARPKT